MASNSLFLKLYRGVFLLLNLGAVGWLLLCRLAAFYNPAGDPHILSLLSFTVFFAIIVNVFFVFFWLFTRRKLRSGLSLITLLICWNLVRSVVGLNYFGNNETGRNTGGLKVMTWNVHLFDLGEWTKDETSKAKIIKLIKAENPDVFCLQEFYWDAADNALPYTSLLQQLGYPYVQFSKENSIKKRRMNSAAGEHEVIDIGNVIFSKFPLRNARSFSLGKPGYNMLSSELHVDSTRIFNLNVVHLTSVRLGEEELAYIDQVKHQGVDAQQREQSKNLLRKLVSASAHRSVLANSVDSLKRFMDYPMIFCGDFNDVPGSFAYQKIKGPLADAFSIKGAGLGRTYQKIFPTLRIDYLFYDPDALEAVGYHRPKVGLSDHYPVIVTLRFKEALAE